jgi:hypothetical protein
VSETASELETTVVWLRCHLHHCLADSEPCANGKVAGRDVEFDNEIVTGGGEGLAV